MAVSIKELTVNTQVNKQNNDKKATAETGGKLSRMDREAIIAECMARVKEMIEYELKP